MKLGVHLSIGKGLEDTVYNARLRKCDTFQIFSRNPRMWRNKKFEKNETEEFKRLLENNKISPIFIHTIYLPNPASSDETLFSKSLNVIEEDLKVSEAFGSDFVVIHPGHHMGKGIGTGLFNLSRAINTALKNVRNGVAILIENMSGSGSDICSTVEEIAEIIRNIRQKKRIGVCLDTCHLYARGYDIASDTGIQDFFIKFDNLIGLEKLKLIHLNDSKYPLGSRIDRHEDIGKGFIGKRGFKNIINSKYLKNIPFILETPGINRLEADLRNLETVRELI